MDTKIQLSAPYRSMWWRGVLLLLALGVVDCLWAWCSMQATRPNVFYAYSHGTNDTIGLSIWVVVISWAIGIVLHLVFLNRAAQRQQKLTMAALIISSLWLTWLCAIAGVFSVYFAVLGDIFHELSGH